MHVSLLGSFSPALVVSRNNLPFARAVTSSTSRALRPQRAMAGAWLWGVTLCAALLVTDACTIIAALGRPPHARFRRRSAISVGRWQNNCLAGRKKTFGRTGITMTLLFVIEKPPFETDPPPPPPPSGLCKMVLLSPNHCLVVVPPPDHGGGGEG